MKPLPFAMGCCLVLFQSAFAEEIPREITDPEEREILGVAAKLTRPSLAFRAAATEKLLEEANFFSERLGLPTAHPIRFSNANIRITAPWFSKSDSPNTNLSKADRVRAATFFASGTVESGDYSFSLGGAQNGVFVHRFRLKGEDSIIALYPELAKTPSLIDNDRAYALATQWLSAVSVDMAALEKAHKPGVFQWFFWGKPEDLPKDQWSYRERTSTNKTMLPVFDVTWGAGPAIKVTLLGSTTELLDLWIHDSSFSKRSPLVISNAFELNTRPDPPVKRLQPAAQEPQPRAAISTNTPPKMPPPFRREIKRP